jgi:adenine phosphoribosyltransferase
MDLKTYIRDIPDFPKPGILFKDITPLLAAPEAFAFALQEMEKVVKAMEPDRILAIESRGFIFGGALAARMGVGFIPVRKPGKLPFTTIRETYDLEYGKDSLEIHHDAIRPGQRVVVVDDLLATGGTALATVRLAEKLGAKVAGLVFLIELEFLHGRSRLDGYAVRAQVVF